MEVHRRRGAPTCFALVLCSALCDLAPGCGADERADGARGGAAGNTAAGGSSNQGGSHGGGAGASGMNTAGNAGNVTGGNGGTGGLGGTAGSSGATDAGITDSGRDAAGAGGRGGVGGAAGSGGGAGDAGPGSDDPLPPCKRTVNVANDGELGPAIAAAVPGDCLLLADGEYGAMGITKTATASSPIVIRARNRLKAIVSSGNIVVRNSAYIVVEGLLFTSAGNVQFPDSEYSRLSRCRISPVEAVDRDWVVISGTSHHVRIDHNDLGPKSVLSNVLMLSGAGSQIVQYSRIDHNYFHDVMRGAGNGWETIRAGLSGFSMSSSHTVIEFNLFRNCGGDPETVSIKSSDNVFRYNTFRAVPGELTLRHGNRNVIYGNYILGDGAATDHGMRVLGQDHKIFNNYIQGVPGAAIFLEGGTSDDNSGALTDFKQVFRAQVVHNTIVNARGIQVGGAHPLNPVDCVVANNIVQGSGALIEEVGAVNSRYLANLVFGGGGLTKPPDQIRVVDPMLGKIGEVFKITAGSPAIDAASGAFPFVTDDIDGKVRSAADIGADELSPVAPTHRMLNEIDVGPDAP